VFGPAAADSGLRPFPQIQLTEDTSMARIIETNGNAITDFKAIEQRLAPLGITLRNWPAPASPRARELMARQSLNDAEKEELLGLVQERFETLKREKGYQTRDMVVIHEAIPGLADMLAKFDKIHTHSDDEVRYILDGSGYFGFVEPAGGQFLLEVSAGDYINVPANAEHWFEMRDCKRCKAVRYFIDTSGWTPHYTGRPVAVAAAATV
jgi:1,2-dihydroxy-3-keto-5-methylthiopentene dioxygenase